MRLSLMLRILRLKLLSDRMELVSMGPQLVVVSLLLGILRLHPCLLIPCFESQNATTGTDASGKGS